MLALIASTAGSAIVSADVVFYTDFTDELGGSTTTVAPATGTFDDAKANPGTFYKSKAGVLFTSDLKAPNWPTPPDTIGAGAARIGFAYQDDFQLRLALDDTWSAFSNYTFTVRYRAWTIDGVTTGSETGKLSLAIGTFEGAALWLASTNDTNVGSAGWTTATLAISGADIAANSSDGNQIVMRLQNNAVSTANTAAWVDTIELSAQAIPEPGTIGLVSLFGGAVLLIRRRFMI